MISSNFACPAYIWGEFSGSFVFKPILIPLVWWWNSSTWMVEPITYIWNRTSLNSHILASNKHAKTSLDLYVLWQLKTPVVFGQPPAFPWQSLIDLAVRALSVKQQRQPTSVTVRAASSQAVYSEYSQLPAKQGRLDHSPVWITLCGAPRSIATLVYN